MNSVLVTGASRGIGKGVARWFADSSYQVYATGRSIASTEGLPEPVKRLTCDHTVESQTAAVFDQLPEDAPEILVNNAWGGYDSIVVNGVFAWNQPFWEGPPSRWSLMIDAGVRAAFDCSVHAARRMVKRKRGLIVNISFWAAQKFIGNTVYGIAKAATDKMTHDMAAELRPHGVTVISLYPGLVRTESVLEAAKGGWIKLDNSESPEFAGLVIDALAKDPELHSRTGQVLVSAQLAKEYGLSDIDGKRPVPLTLDTV
jgi:dehydrogenase/reductase SDR family member 1